MKSFPNLVPIFPLSGVIYFPKTNLPLNIFEQRYLDLVTDAFQKDKLMGMIQSQRQDKEIFKVGCLGKISDLQKSEDGRILVNLTGLTRFEVIEEVKSPKLYREFKVSYEKYAVDISPADEKISSETLIGKAKTFFKRNGLLINWKEFEKLDKDQQINTLAMIAPITVEEKQKLLESLFIKDKVKNLENIIDFYLYDNNIVNLTVQ